MADPKTDKKTESITALKNANKHLSDLFNDLNRKDGVLNSVSADLQRVAAQCGDIQVKYWSGNQQLTGSLKNWLNSLASQLESVR